MPETSYPASISIDRLLKAGKFVKPVKRTNSILNLEYFDLIPKDWKSAGSLSLLIDENKFASGAFRDAFKGTVPDKNQIWVIKRYNTKAKDTIINTLSSTEEIHTRKQVQMHTVAREITKKFTSIVPKVFGKSFTYNKVFYSQIDGEPVTVEEFVPGTFCKYVNNDGMCVVPNLDGTTEEVQEIFDKAQCLVHYSYLTTNERLMLLDIQGANYSLYDPEIATQELMDQEEVFFCCGNLSTSSMERFMDEHVCGKFCDMIKKVIKK